MTNQGRRMYLQRLLSAIPEVRKAYFQPPRNVKMEFPCIIYQLDGAKSLHADDNEYFSRNKYNVIIIDSNPDSVIPGIFHKNFNMSSFDRTYTVDNLNHWVYTLYF